MSRLTLVDVYPGSMFPQGDGGNLRMLEHRARGRGIETQTVRLQSATRSRTVTSTFLLARRTRTCP